MTWYVLLPYLDRSQLNLFMYIVDETYKQKSQRQRLAASAPGHRNFQVVSRFSFCFWGLCSHCVCLSTYAR